MHQSVLRYAKQNILFRLLPLLFAAIMLLSGAPAMVRFFSQQLQELTAVAPENLPVDEHTLKITLDGSLATAMDLPYGGKQIISADGLKGKATYQWQIKHPEKENVWVNIYDATSKELPVTAALVKSVLSEEGTAQLRCRAYTSDYAYLTPAITVKLADLGSGGDPLLGATGGSDSSLGSGGQTPLGSGVSPLADDAIPEFVTVTIEYHLYIYTEQPDGSMEKDRTSDAFTPYIATLKSGTNLTDTDVTHPTIVGFKASLTKRLENDVVVQEYSASDPENLKNFVDIDLTNVTTNVTYVVEYHPVEVPYEVHYFFQNIYDDLYVEDTTMLDEDGIKATALVLQGETGTKPDSSKTERKFPGFTSLYYQPELIAADGSTVFQVFYERDYYLMEFDCNGGYGADTIYVRYGTYISVPNPVRMGYEFAGWNKGEIQLDANGRPLKDSEGKIIVKYEQAFDPDHPEDFEGAELPETMGKENTLYRAEWKNVKTTYTVAYWREKADGSGYEFWGNAVIGLGDDGQPNGTVVSNTKVSGKGDLTNELALCGKRPHNHNTNGCVKYCEKPEHTDACCDKEEHASHNASCCILEEHRHGLSCGFGYGCSKTVHTHGDGNCVYNDAIHTHGDGSCNVNACTNDTHHTHIGSCYSCGLTAHAHTDACYTNESQYYTFVEADQDVLVKGDGSTVVNVYYDRKEYELRFYYARTDTSGGTIRIANSTGNGYTASNSNPFSVASWANPDSSVLPTVNDDYFISGGGATGYDQVGSYRYYYLSLKAKYNANIEEEWPAASLGSLDGEIWNFGSWASENGSGYRTNHSASNANIVGAYPYLTAELIVDPNADVTSGKVAHHFIAWWGQEGRSASQNDKVSSHFYHIYYEVLPGHESDPGVVSYTYNGVTKYFQLSRNLQFNAAHKSGSPTRVDAFEYTGYEVFGPDEDSDSSDNMNNSAGHGHYCNTYYYTRSEHTLSFYNYNDSSASLPDQILKYGQSLSSFKPASTPEKPQGDLPYPTGIEPSAYEFIGWYTTPIFDENTKMTDTMWNSMTMPMGDVTLYAKWVPIQRKVHFYELYTDIEIGKYWYAQDQNGNQVPAKYPIEVEHGSLLGTTYSFIPERTGYDFVGWFYMDQDNKKKFAPDSMEIRRDLHLFAEWHSKTDTQYEVFYVLDQQIILDSLFTLTEDFLFRMPDASYPTATLSIGDEVYESGDVIPAGTVLPINTVFPAGTEIAFSTAGHASAGKTKTFSAKPRSELYAPFSGLNMFPNLSSHSILMSDDASENTYSFSYVRDDKVWYRIRYLNKIDNSKLADEVVAFTGDAIITPKFKPVEGFLPERYYIRKVLAADGETGSATNINPENEVIFYYTPDKDHGLYTIEYYQETVEGGDFVLAQSKVGHADKDTVVSALPLPEFSGFTHDSSRNVVKYYDVQENGTDANGNKIYNYIEKEKTGADATSGVVTTAGLEIRIYYQRNQYDYKIEYREYGAASDAEPLHVINGSAMYASDISHTAAPTCTKAGKTYVFYTVNAQPDEQTITIRPNNTGNVITFYYELKKTTVQYEAKCTVAGADSFGGVSLNQEMAATAGNLAGSKAVPGVGYTFVGWYDENDQQVTATGWVTEITESDESKSYRLKPLTFNDHDDDDVVKYYALFTPISTSMTITNKVIDGMGPVAFNFVYHLQGQGKLAYVDRYIVISSNGSIVIDSLPIGDYMLTQTTFSWEHTLDSITATGIDAENHSVNISNKEITFTAVTQNAENDRNQITFSNAFAESNWRDGESKTTITPTSP